MSGARSGLSDINGGAAPPTVGGWTLRRATPERSGAGAVTNADAAVRGTVASVSSRTTTVSGRSPC
ncbi:MAG: hypothetical protein ACE368_07590 [Paracoccaceae bacterium]